MIVYMPWKPSWNYQLRELVGAWPMNFLSTSDDPVTMRALVKREHRFDILFTCKPILLERV